jgi:hypothetical protein
MRDAKEGLLVIAHGSIVPGAEHPGSADSLSGEGGDRSGRPALFLAEEFWVHKMRRVLREAAAAHPGIRLTEAAPLGTDPRLVEVVLERIAEAAVD